MTAPLYGACVFGQSGGPTSVINASAAGVFREALDQKCITKVYGAAYGISGILYEVLYDISAEDPAQLDLLRNTPSSALGSVRYKLKGTRDLDRILEVFKKYNIRYFFYNGGNDSMDTCDKVSKYLHQQKYDCRVIGVCKTIDNDLVGTSHCPGYGSAARFVASSVMSMYLDSTVYRTGQVTIVEVMGRDAGWLTASAALASVKGCGPDLIYLPESTFDPKEFIEEVRDVLASRQGRNVNCFIVVSEGIRTADGRLVHAQPAQSGDRFGHPKLGGVAAALEGLVLDAFPGVKSRSIELNILQRCGSFVASGRDVEEAYEVGRFAVRSAVGGATDKMVAFERVDPLPGQYKVKYILVDIGASANAVRRVPQEWILPGHRGLTNDFVSYALPLIEGDPKVPYENGLPKFAQLKKVLATKPAAHL